MRDKASQVPKAGLPPPPPQTLTEALAFSVAVGNAVSAFNAAATFAAGSGDHLAGGRYWYAGGTVVERGTADEVMRLLLDVATTYDGLPAEALYLHVTARVRLPVAGAYTSRPLPERLAWQAFATAIGPLVAEARAEAARKRQLDAPVPPALPDRVGTIGERIWHRPPQLGDRFELGGARKAEAAE